MTLHRRPEIPYTDASQGTCRWCGESIHHQTGKRKGELNLRRRWHPECVEIYNASDPREARRRIRKRDRGICAVCRLDTYALRREIRKMGRGRTRELRDRGFKPRKSLWELDHIAPLIDGGTHADDNLQTLCTPCHTQKTADEARARAQCLREERNATAALEREHSKPARTSRAKTRPLDEILSRADAVNSKAAKLLDGARS